jgi:hypothetical protein
MDRGGRKSQELRVLGESSQQPGNLPTRRLCSSLDSLGADEALTTLAGLGLPRVSGGRCVTIQYDSYAPVRFNKSDHSNFFKLEKFNLLTGVRISIADVLHFRH